MLHWLQSKKPLPVFVENRLKEIKSHKGILFKYVPTQENPADLATRGKSPAELQHSIWWNSSTVGCKKRLRFVIVSTCSVITK